MPLQVVDPTSVGQGADALNNKALMAYYNAKLKGDSDTLAFQKAQEALKQAMNIYTNFGYAPGGDWTQLGAGGATQPPPGTPTQSIMASLGYAAMIPGDTGTGAGQTSSQLAGQAGTAQSAAGLTGFYNAPRQSEYTPGTWVRLDPSTYDYNQYGDQISYVTGSGQLQRTNTQQAKAMGWNGDLGALTTVPAWKAQQLELAPPQDLPQQTLAGLSQYSDLNTAAQNRAIAQSGATGMYQAPTAIQPPGTDWGGAKFQDVDQATQQAYFYSNGGDWTAAMNKWVADRNAAASAAGQSAPTGGPAQETMAAQGQYFDQAQQLAQMYGQYYTPGAPGQAGTAGTNMPTAGQTTQAAQEQAYTQWLRSTQESREQWTAQQTAAQNYLTLMSQLRGPADYAQYQKVLGATPGGMKDLVSAAAGQYVPASGATTGTQPQSVSLGNFVGGTTGGADTQSQAALGSLVAPNQMAPQTWNALQPSQQQMLLGVWESQGYNKDDAKNLFTQSLPKYATNSPSTGSFRLQ